MDIKLKNIKYAAGTKAAAVILIWLCFLCAVGSGVFLLCNGEIAAGKSYFETRSFRYEFEGLVYDTIQTNVRLRSIEDIKASGESENVITGKIGYFNRIKDRVSGMVNFIYYIKDLKTGEVITNITASEPLILIEKQPAKVFVNQTEFTTSNLNIYGYDLEKLLAGTSYEVHAALLDPLKQGDIFYEGYMDYKKIKEQSLLAYVLLVTSLILLAIAAIYLAYVAGRREKGGEILYSNVDRIYTDVHTALVLAAAYISVSIAGRFFRPGEAISWIFFLIILSVDAFIGISYVLSMIRQIKGRSLIENTLLMVLIKSIKVFAKACFEGKLFRPSILLLLLGYALINGILFDVGVDINNGAQEPIFTVLLLGFNAAAVYFAAKSLLSLSKIITMVKEISSGNLDYTLDSSAISVAFSGFAEDIKNIQGGIKKAVDEAVKGERMKTELITNVSHDLKTPLTSIVNYVDLLKNEDLNNERAKEYVNILEEKSERLKHLIEDLVEASKASSGNLPVNAEKVDLHELVMQACGEYEEKINKAGLDIRVNAEERNIYVYADGMKMGRIIGNLLSNAVKYSMSGSRVYINLEESGEYGLLTIKNISAFPLNIPPEQLTERFVRGDASRTTEGSGLGLSIAQSLTELQRGSFMIEIDGDLFKVKITLPLWKERV